jgi:hypothetical protein
MIKKAVYSLWTGGSPGFGFNDEKEFARFFSLSVIMSNKHFDEVELVTDERGAELVDRYGIPVSVRTGLDELMEGVHENHWSMCKIHACAMQEGPFMHVDNDVIWFKPPPERILGAPASFQQLETGLRFERYYRDLSEQAMSWPDKPEWFVEDLSAYNCGFVGFNDLSVIGEWRDFADSYVRYTGGDMSSHLTPLLYEQIGIKQLCDARGVQVELLRNHYDTLLVGVGNIDGDPDNLGYTHCFSGNKRVASVTQRVNSRLMYENPELCDRINSAD